MEDTTQSQELYKRSDGFSETPEGDFAVTMLKVSQQYLDADENTINVFRFKSSYMAETVTIVWPAGERLALLPQDVAKALVNRGYATLPSDKDVAAYNAAVGADLAPAAPTAAKQDGGAPTAPHSGGTPPAAPTPAPAPTTDPSEAPSAANNEPTAKATAPAAPPPPKE